MDYEGKAYNEILHGKKLAKEGAESAWGWSSPAGVRRAQRRAELIVSGAELGPGKRVLEIGCGTGNFTELFAGSGAAIVAVDISPELVAQARQRGLPEDQVTFIIKRFEECELDGPFDAIIGSSVLHHLDVADSVAKIHHLLKPGGIMSFAEPNMLNPQIFLERTLRFLPVFSYVSPDETAFVRFSLRQLLARRGFTQISITPFDWLHPATPAAWISLVLMGGRLLENAPLAREFAGSLHIAARRKKS